MAPATGALTQRQAAPCALQQQLQHRGSRSHAGARASLAQPLRCGFQRSTAPLVLGRQPSRAVPAPRRGTLAPLAAVATGAPPAQVAAAREDSVLDCVIVGGGISGLCTAQALVSDHAQAVGSWLLTEARERVGGNITSVSNDEGYLWEEGPNSFQPNDFILKAAVDAGIADDLVLGDPTAPRFVLWGGRLRATPSGPDVLTFDLLSLWGKLRAGLGAAGLKGGMPEYEESVEQFVRRNLGAEVFERLIEPFCSGVYAGDPSKLSMKAAFGKVYDLEKKGGSIVGGVLALMRNKKPAPERDPRLPPKPKGQTVGSFRRGLQQLPEAIGGRLSANIRTGWALQDISKAGGVFTLRYSTPQGTKELRARTVALTAPAYVVADLVRKDCVDASDALRAFDYPPVAAVTLSYPMSAIRPDRLNDKGELPGFGQLHPRSQGVVTLGTIYSSSLFPGRAPPGHQLLLNYIGGATNRGILDQSQDQIVAQVDRDLRKMLLREDAPPPRTVGVRVWPKAIPQFNVGHQDTLQAAKDAIQDAGWDGLVLGGNYVSGVALGKCVEYAYTFASEVAQQCAKAKAQA